jgi:hypothetical protein
MLLSDKLDEREAARLSGPLLENRSGARWLESQWERPVVIFRTAAWRSSRRSEPP